MILKGARASLCLQATSRVGRKGFCWGRRHARQIMSYSGTALLLWSYTLLHPRMLVNLLRSFISSLAKTQRKLVQPFIFFVERLPQRISINTRGLIHRLHDWGQTVWRGGNRSSSAVWTGARQAVLLGHYFLICKKKGLDSVMAKVTSSSVNSMFLKNTWILKEEHLLGFPDKRAQGVFVLDLLPHPDFLL